MNRFYKPYKENNPFEELPAHYDDSVDYFGDKRDRYVLDDSVKVPDLVKFANKHNLGLYRDKDELHFYDASEGYQGWSRTPEVDSYKGKTLFLGKVGKTLWNKGMSACRLFNNSYYWSAGGVHALEKFKGEVVYEANGRFELVDKRKEVFKERDAKEAELEELQRKSTIDDEMYDNVKEYVMDNYDAYWEDHNSRQIMKLDGKLDSQIDNEWEVIDQKESLNDALAIMKSLDPDPTDKSWDEDNLSETKEVEPDAN